MENDEVRRRAELEAMAALIEQLEARIAVMKVKVSDGSVHAAGVASLKNIIDVQREMNATLMFAPENIDRLVALRKVSKRLFADNAALLQEAGVPYDPELHLASEPPTIGDFEDDPELNFDDFDDEPGSGGGYNRDPITRRIYSDDGIARRIVTRFRGKPIERISVHLEEKRNGAFGLLMRYDDTPLHGGRFHRHRPGWPEPGKIDAFLDDVPSAKREPCAVREIRGRYTAWEAEVFGQEGGDPT